MSGQSRRERMTSALYCGTRPPLYRREGSERALSLLTSLHDGPNGLTALSRSGGLPAPSAPGRVWAP